MGTTRIQYQANELEYVCLDCPMPLGCDESHPLCLYRHLKPAQNFHRLNRRDGNTCPCCGKSITRGGQPCAEHKWYR